MTALIRQSWACLNANDFARFLTLMTDEEAPNALPADLILAAASGEATPEAAPEAERIAVLDVERLPDGRGLRRRRHPH